METDLRHIKDRHQMIRYFDGYSIEQMEELGAQRSKKPWVKSQLIELQETEANQQNGIKAIFQRRGVHLTEVDEKLFSVSDEREGEIGFLEQLRPRVVSVYSTRKSNELDRWVRNLVKRSPDIDNVWLSGLTFNVLWGLVAKLSDPRRFTSLVFTHDSVFDMDVNVPVPEEEDDDEKEKEGINSSDEDKETITERRATSFRLVDRISVIKDKLERLQALYSPLYAISRLRFPSPVGRGGHDFYDNGKVTNRSESFRDHRSHLLYVVRIYEQLLKTTENQAWYSIQESVSMPGQFGKIVGAPVTVIFQHSLEQSVFDRWITSTFKRRVNKFRLWGHPIQLGPAKVHVYGVDRHLWQPIFLELTSKGCTAIIPNGTCGNTVHRLVTNIQRYLDPGAEAYIGGKPYRQVVSEAAQGVSYDLKN